MSGGDIGTVGFGLAAFDNIRFETLKSATMMLADREALDSAYLADGAVFFRSVLDPSTLAPVRDQVVAALERWGVARWVEGDLRWSGRPVHKIDNRELHDVPALNDLSRQCALGIGPITALADAIWGRPTDVSPNFWLFVSLPDDPTYTTVPHHDGLCTNKGTDYRRLWLPLTEMPFGDGGLALALGNDLRSAGLVPGYKLRAESGRPAQEPALRGALIETLAGPLSTAAFALGDAVCFHGRTVHAGVPLVGDRIRIALATVVGLKGDQHEITWTVPEIEDHWARCTEVATALGATETEAHYVFRLLKLYQIVPDHDSVATALGEVRSGVTRPPPRPLRRASGPPSQN